MAALGAGVLTASLLPLAAQAAVTDDPRVGLAPDESAILNLEMLSSNPMAPGTFINSDLAFTGDYAVAGNFAGVTFWDISDPADPELTTNLICPGGQNDVSVFDDLLFVSVESGGRVSCDPTETSSPSFRGVRIFDISDVTMPEQIATVPTCRGSHTHTLVEDPSDPDTVYVYVSGTGGVSDTAGLTGCTDGAPDSADPARWRIDVIEVPLGAPETAAVVAGPRLFADYETGEVDGLQNTPPAPLHPSGIPWSPQPVTDACHDITAYPEIGLAAGACEGNGILIDITDPANPVRVAEATDPNFAYWHSATFNNDGTKVVFTDEWGGGTQPRCRETDRLEWGANAIFDVVRTEDGPELEFASYYKMPAAQTSAENCVAHNGTLVPLPGRDVMIQAWYQGGTSLWDFTDSANPVEMGYFDRGPFGGLAGYWSTYWHNGEIFGTEIGRGFDSFDVLPSEHLDGVEIAAAKQVQTDQTNAQLQERIVWPASFTTVRAWQSAAERQGELTSRESARLTTFIDRAERFSTGPRSRAAVAQLRAAERQLGHSDVEAGLGDALLELADEIG